MQVEALTNMLRRHLFKEVLARRAGQSQEQAEGGGNRSMSSLIDAVGFGTPDLLAAASACYWVAYSQGAGGYGLVPLLGLPWTVAGDVLGQYRAMLV
jgi:hypothetical protein